MNIDFRDCMVPYRNHGVQFNYPDIWQLDEQSDGDDILITVSGDGTCFWLLRILAESPAPPQVVESCLSAFREEYDELDEEKTEMLLAEMPAVAREVEFFCLELLNSASMCSVRTSDFTLLVLWQGTSHELEDCRQILEYMTSSVRAVALMD